MQALGMEGGGVGVELAVAMGWDYFSVLPKVGDSTRVRLVTKKEYNVLFLVPFREMQGSILLQFCDARSSRQSFGF